MNQDNEIKAFFQANKPQTDEGTQFMQKLTDRIEALEQVKQYQLKATRECYRVAAISMFLGILLGGFSVVLFMFPPVSISEYMMLIQVKVANFCLEWKLVCYIAFALTATIVGIAGVLKQKVF